MDKIKVLWEGESSFLFTGYAVYARELLSRMYKDERFEVAELGCYGKLDDPRQFEVPWRYYSNLPSNQQEKQEYDRTPKSQFGAWKFEEVVLDFKPDFILSIRDIWMESHVHESPFRPYYHWVYMPTVDSAPQMEGWIQTFMDADSIFTYSEFGHEVLEKEGGGKINLCGVASPGVNLDNFKPLPNRNALRENLGIKQEDIVVGTVMRNQKRKLFPDLIQAFKKFSDEYKGEAYLYLHTSYPDLGWDIPRLIREAGIGSKTIMTYVCEKCGKIMPQFFQDAVAFCGDCSAMSAHLPNTQTAVPDNKMAEVYAVMDVYVQYSVAEGCGISQIEAAACAIPIMSVDYSAMSSIVRNLNGYPIKVQRLYRESETHAYRAYPDNDDLVQKLLMFAKLPPSMRAKKSRETLLACRKIYNWDRIAQIWIDHIAALPLKRLWDLPPKIFKPKTEIPGRLTPDVLVRWGIVNVLGKPELLNTYIEHRMVRDLNYQARIAGYGGPYYSEDSTLSQQNKYQPYGTEECLNELLAMREKINYWEARRCGLDNTTQISLHIKPDLRELTL